MKPLGLLTFYLIFLTNSICYTQTNIYHPFKNVNVRWSILNKSWETGLTDTTDAFYSLCGDGDTIIDGKSYLQIKNVLDDTCSYSIAGLLREDTILKKVYLNRLGLQFDGDTLLFDFSVEIGQSVNHCLPFAHFDSSKVNRIDSILIGDNYRKKIIIKCYNEGIEDSTFWIEGLGGVFGPCPFTIEPSNFGYGFTGINNSKSFLICYKENGEILYEEIQSFYNCDFFIEVPEITFQSNIKIFPNPASKNEIYISSDRLYEVDLFSSNGIWIANLTVNGITQVDISKFSAGVYFLVFKNEMGPSIIQTFVKP